MSIVIKCYNDAKIFDCLESIDEDCEVVVSYAGNSALVSNITNRYPNARIIQVPKGNLSVSCNIGISASTGNSVLIMDSDATFKAGSLSLIMEHLTRSLVVKPRIIYEYDRSIIGSRIVAITRQQFNDKEIRALTPGLAFRKEIAELIGGYFFDERVPFTEDAVLDWRLRRAGIGIDFLPKAIIYHSPISLYHDLRASFRMGFGHQRAVHFAGRENDNRVTDIFKRLLNEESLKCFKKEELENRYFVSLYTLAWDALYNFGYFTERYKIALRKGYRRFADINKEE